MIIELAPHNGWHISLFKLDSGEITYNAYSNTKPVKQLTANSKAELYDLIDKD